MDNDENDCVLPADTLAILQEFLKEQRSKDMEENWQLSQFWYNAETKVALADASVKVLEKFFDLEASIALLSSPSLYEEVKSRHKNVTLFEFDERFKRYGEDFVQYDYRQADEPEYLQEFSEKFDLVILDPPFLSEECLHKMSNIVRKLQKPNAKVVLCSGKIIKDLAEIHLGLKMCRFEPQHERNLGNDFASYANFDLDELLLL